MSEAIVIWLLCLLAGLVITIVSSAIGAVLRGDHHPRVHPDDLRILYREIDRLEEWVNEQGRLLIRWKATGEVPVEWDGRCYDCVHAKDAPSCPKHNLLRGQEIAQMERHHAYITGVYGYGIQRNPQTAGLGALPTQTMGGYTFGLGGAQAQGLGGLTQAQANLVAQRWQKGGVD